MLTVVVVPPLFRGNRFIPDDVTFDEEPKDLATDVDLSAYTPELFTSTAAATSKVRHTPSNKLLWS